MIKVMIFIDGSWLYRSTPALGARFGKPEFRIDYGKLPRVLAARVAEATGLGPKDVDVVRTTLFASKPVNYNPRDEELVAKQMSFFNMLAEDYHYETELYDINFRGSRVKPESSREEPFRPTEKCVDVALASAMLYYAAIPNAYDIALAVVGDRDYIPALRTIRRLGRRVAIATVEENCAREYKDPVDRLGVRDFDTILLGDLLDELELVYEPQWQTCESELHEGDPLVLDSYRPRKGEKFFCDACRRKFREQKDAALEEAGLLDNAPAAIVDEQPKPGNGNGCHTGAVKHLVEGKAYGFIAGENGHDYFFHATDLESPLVWNDMRVGMRLDFEVKKEPTVDRAGAAGNIRIHGSL
ncbi:MAG: NYN domain-containing protein [Deltaproteobacteria bacterium]|nr:NYN domain-containing protein [Deltaproteobacteria bacterium]